MAEIIRMPRLSDTMEEGNIVAWLKKVGDKVEPGTVLAEVETDKATMELESFHSGVLLYIGVPSGPVPVNGILAVIGKEGEDYKAQLASESAPAPAATVPVEAKKESTEPAISPIPTTEVPAESGERIKASPLAKAIASEKGIDLSKVSGTGENGRIVKKDLEGTASTPQPASTPSKVYPSSGATDEPLTQMRKIIARKLSESLFTAPHFYLTAEINMGKVMASRKQINDSNGIKISINDFVVKASALALKKHPNINAAWMGDFIRINHDVNIGVAVAVEDGLMVPVVQHADQKSLLTLNTEIKSLATKAKEKKIVPQEMQGNTFTISNLGMYDIDEFTAIINPPDACILAVGSIIEKPIVIDGQIVVGNMMKVTLSCDHRVVDGASGAQFLMTLKSLLQEPIQMLV